MCYVREVAMDYIVDYQKEVTSTNTICMDLGKTTQKNHYVLVAESQTQGRGRLGRDWLSRPGEGVYMSILERPVLKDTQSLAPVTLIAALCIRKAIGEVTGMECDIKWPNDLVYKGKKVVGILTQSYGMPRPEYFVVGMGINLFHEKFPEELEDKATSLYLEKFCEKSNSDLKKRLIESIIENWKNYYNQFLQSDFSAVSQEYNQYLAGVGTEVVVHDPKGEFRGISRGVNHEGELLVETEGKIRAIASGEVSVRGVNGYV